MSFALAALVAVGVAACDDNDDPAGPSENLVELAAANSDLETLVAAIQAAGLDTDLSADGPFTVFAPADAAFDALPEGTVAALLESGNVDVLTELLLGHVVAGDIRAADLSDGQMVTTLSGDQFTVSIAGGEVRIGGATVQAADVEASNGVVHVVDGVITGGLTVTERARVTPALSALVDAVIAAGLATTLDDESATFTIFAPVNAAFEAITVPTDPDVLESILLYHGVSGAAFSGDLSDGQTLTTLSGGTLEVDITGGDVSIQAAGSTASVALPDIQVSNGVVHVIDTVLLPGT